MMTLGGLERGLSDICYAHGKVHAREVYTHCTRRKQYV